MKRQSISTIRLASSFIAIIIGLSATAIFAQAPKAVSHADILRGEYGPYRANNDLISYGLDIRIDPDKKIVSGKNAITFKMLKDDTRIQLDLYENLNVDKILLGNETLRYTRDSGAVFVDLAKPLKAGKTYTIDFYYSGTPQTIGRFGGFTFGKDPAGRPWIFTACEGLGASLWWPNKDQWHDEVQNMTISVAIPNDLVDASNGKFIGKKDLGDGYTQWNWKVNYPINNYDVSVNIAKFDHWSDKYGDLDMDFYALPEDVERAKKQYSQAKGMLEAFQHYFGEYPFKKDGYKLIQAPYAGMEHQSAVTYGNMFENGYYKRDWTGVGISTRFDFIIIHESGHEWFGNAVSAADVSDMWIQEGWTTYLECLYVEYFYGHDDYLKYTNALKKKVQNKTPIITPRGTNTEPPQDQYFKGALFLHTLRSVINDDKKWFALIHDVYQRFKYQNIMTEDMIAFMDQRTGMKLTPIFDQYLRHTAIPKLELKVDDAKGELSYRWIADEANFAMPVKVGTKDKWTIIYPTTTWKTDKTDIKNADLSVATDLYYIDVVKQ